MSEGHKKHERRALANYVLLPFQGRILPSDDAAAHLFAEIMAHRRAMGRRIEVPDAMIAAICRLQGATLATRNTPDFEDTGITLVNPWDPDHDLNSGVR